MRARVFSARIKPGRWDEALDVYRSLEIEFKEQDGFEWACFLGDSESGRAVSVTFWDSQEAMEGSVWSDQLARFVDTLEAVPGMEHYDVAFETQR